MSKHNGNFEVYGDLVVGANISGSKYIIPHDKGVTGEALVMVGEDLVFTNVAPYIDIAQTSGGAQLVQDVNQLISTILDVSGSVDNFIELFDTPKPASLINAHEGEIIIVDPNASLQTQKIAYSGVTIGDIYSDIASISGDWQAQIDAITIPTSATFLSDYDDRYVNVAGDTMVGDLNMNDNFINFDDGDGRQSYFGAGDFYIQDYSNMTGGNYLEVYYDNNSNEFIFDTVNGRALRINDNRDIAINTNLSIFNLSGTNGNIVTHDANGKLLDSGLTIADISGNPVDLSPYTLLSTTASISGDLQAQIDSITFPTSATFLSDYDDRYVNVTGDTMTGQLAGISGSAGTPAFTFTGDFDTGIFSTSTNTFSVATGGTERVRVYDDGGVRIGGTQGTSPGNSRFMVVTSNATPAYSPFFNAPPIAQFVTNDNGRVGISLFNQNIGSSADIRMTLMEAQSDRGYMTLTMPSQANTDLLFNTPRGQLASLFLHNLNRYNRSLALGTVTTGDVRFATDSLERMRVWNGGGVQIGGNYTSDVGAGNLQIHGISGANGNIVTHDEKGKLLDSGVSIDSLIVSLSGDYVNVSGDTMTGNLTIFGTQDTPNQIAPLIVSAAGLPADFTAMTETTAVIVGTNGSRTRLMLDCYKNGGATTLAPILTFRSSNGTASAPTAVRTNDLLANLSLQAHNGTNYASASKGFLTAWASSAWTNTSHPYYVDISTTNTNATNVGLTRMRVWQDGGISIGSVHTTSPGQHSVSISPTTDVSALSLVGSANAASPMLSVRHNAAATSVNDGKGFEIGVVGETFGRGMFYSNGAYGIGAGSTTRDSFIFRVSAGVIGIGNTPFTPGENSAQLRVYGDVVSSGTVYCLTDTLTDSATINYSAPLSDNFTLMLTSAISGSRILETPTNLVSGMRWVIRVKQPSSGGPIPLSFSSAYKFPFGQTPTLSTAANAVDTISCYYDGTDILSQVINSYGTVAGINIAGSTLNLTGSVNKPNNVINTNTNLGEEHYTVAVDVSGGPVTVTLPDTSVTSVRGRMYIIKKIDASANAVTVQRSGSDLIDGATTVSITGQYQVLRVHARSSGGTWDVI